MPSTVLVILTTVVDLFFDFSVPLPLPLSFTFSFSFSFPLSQSHFCSLSLFHALISLLLYTPYTHSCFLLPFLLLLL